MLRAEVAAHYGVPEDALKQIRAGLSEGESSAVDDCTVARYYISSKRNISLSLTQIRGYVAWWSSIGPRIPKSPESGKPLFVSVRGFDGIPDGNYDCEAEGVPASFKKFWASLGGGALHKTDKFGTPIYIDRIGKYDVEMLAKNTDVDTICDWHVAGMEFMVKRVFKACEEKFARPVTNHIAIMDCAGLGLKHLNVSGLRMLKRISEVDSLYYPERLMKLYVVNTTPLFIKVWSIVKNWIDKDILKKISVGQKLYDMVDRDTIPPENLPQYLGGKCVCPRSLGGCVPTPSDIVSARLCGKSEKK